MEYTGAISDDVVILIKRGDLLILCGWIIELFADSCVDLVGFPYKGIDISWGIRVRKQFSIIIDGPTPGPIAPFVIIMAFTYPWWCYDRRSESEPVP